MKHFLFIPSCALMALGMLTSCQKEEKSAQQLAEELTAELQKVVDYKTAEAYAPRVEALNKRFQNASVRVFSADSNALASSSANGYADAVCRLVREMGRVQASKPVTSHDGEVEDISLVRAVGVGSGVAQDATARDQFAKGQLYTYESTTETNNNPPAFAEYYGSSKMAAALAYVATSADNGAFKFASDEDVPAVPTVEEVEPDVATAEQVAPAEEPAADEEPAASDEEPVVADDEPASDDEEPAADDEPAEDDTPSLVDDLDISGDATTEDTASADEEPAAEDEPATADEEPVAADEEPAAADEEPAAADEEPAAEEEPVAADEEPVAEDEPVAADEEPATDEEPAADEEPAEEDDAMDDSMGDDLELEL